VALRSVYQHDDYRVFLREFYDHKKRLSLSYSYRAFAEKAGLNSPNYLKLVIDGGRNLTVANIHAFAKALGLARDELAYFEALVLCNQASASGERAFYKRRLDEIRARKPERQVKLSGKDQLIAHHLFPALLLALLGVEADGADAAADALAVRLGISREFAREAVTIIEERGILRREAGRYQVNASHYVFHDPLPNRAQKRFLRDQMLLSLRALERDYGEQARFFSHTFTAAQAAFPVCVDDVKAFIEEMTLKCDRMPSESLVQLNIQLFPLRRGLLTSS